MEILTGAYNPDAEAAADLGRLPTGEYLAQIVDSDMKPTSNNNGHFLELVYEVIEPAAYKGRKHWERLNLDSQNAQAVEIANRSFASIREATGVHAPRDSQELHFKPHVIRVEFYAAGQPYTGGSKKGQPRDRDEAVIKAWKKAEGVQAQAQAPAANTAPAAAPWARSAA